MSEAKKEKVQMDPKYILKLAGVLMLISAIVAGLLGLVNGVTWEKIAEIQAQKLQASLQAVFPDATFTEIPVTDELVAIADQEDAESGLSAIYESSTGGFPLALTAALMSLSVLMQKGMSLVFRWSAMPKPRVSAPMSARTNRTKTAWVC